MSQEVKQGGVSPGKEKGRSDEHRQDEVEIVINNTPRMIHRGHQAEQEIKRVGSVALADELVQIVDGQLVVLADSAAVVIKGGERFLSQPRDSASSHDDGRA
ncbi:MAG TPA: hypothetical protein VGC13_31180 [Longimicrobium sp.]|jgi:hypothetical protein|uniref:hypothetical protein n=1 Tax=Longimicrobium sp. TaxID=2029185 RepID=UPI002ED96EB2